MSINGYELFCEAGDLLDFFNDYTTSEGAPDVQSGINDIIGSDTVNNANRQMHNLKMFGIGIAGIVLLVAVGGFVLKKISEHNARLK